MRLRPYARAAVALALQLIGCRDEPPTSTSTSTVGGSAPDAPVSPTVAAHPTAQTSTPTSTSASTQSSPSARPVRFVAVGDTGKGNAAAYRVARAIANKCAADGCDFVLLLGDNVYESGIASPEDPLIVERFEKVFAPVGVPFYPVLGNHDYGQNGLGTDFTRGVNEVLYSKRSAKWRMPDAFYTLAFGVLDIFALDTNLAYFERAPEQSAKMRAAMQKSRARWKIAYGHHPYMSNGLHGNAGNYNGVTQPPALSGVNVKTFVEGTVCGSADAYLSGHDHSLQWLTPTCNGTELLVSGAGAETTTLPGKNESHFQSTELGFIYGVATDTKLSMQFVNDTGKPLFSRAIEKPHPTAADGGSL